MSDSDCAAGCRRPPDSETQAGRLAGRRAGLSPGRRRTRTIADGARAAARTPGPTGGVTDAASGRLQCQRFESQTRRPPPARVSSRSEALAPGHRDWHPDSETQASLRFKSRLGVTVSRAAGCAPVTAGGPSPQQAASSESTVTRVVVIRVAWPLPPSESELPGRGPGSVVAAVPAVPPSRSLRLGVPAGAGRRPRRPRRMIVTQARRRASHGGSASETVGIGEVGMDDPMIIVIISDAPIFHGIAQSIPSHGLRLCQLSRFDSGFTGRSGFE
jgi:hypothetical protein